MRRVIQEPTGTKYESAYRALSVLISLVILRIKVHSTNFVIDLEGAGNGVTDAENGRKVQLWGSYAAGKNQLWRLFHAAPAGTNRRTSC